MNSFKQHYSIPISKTLKVSLLSALCAFNPFAYSQEDAPEDEDIYTLSPFEVDESSDMGYLAENTLAGSRLNMSLSDIAQSVTVMTPEFLEDVAAENIDDILLYAINAETYLNEDSFSENQIGTQRQFTPNNRNNIRGNRSSVSVDFNQGGGSIDTYNASRVEISQGPNAVLFGFGGAGGIINLSTQRAHTHRDSYRLQSTVGSFDQWRNIFNVNKVILEDKLALRVITLLEKANDWREGKSKDTERTTFVMSFIPWKNTHLNVSYEDGGIDQVFTVNQGAMDGYSEWALARVTEEYQDLFGDGTYDQINSNRGRNNANLNRNGLVRGNNARRKVFIDNDIDYAAYDWPANAGNLLPMTHYPRTQPLISNFMFPKESIDISAFTPYGSGSYRNEGISNTKITLTQQLMPEMHLKVSYWDSKNSAYQRYPSSRSITLTGEPSKVFDGIADASPYDNVQNPFSPTEDGFYLYSETSLGEYDTFVNSETFRVQWSYRLATERWGTHQFGLLWSEKERSFTRRSDRRVVDVRTALEHGVDLAAYDLSPSIGNARNHIWRRHYYMAGPDYLPVDDTEIRFGDFDEPVSMLVHDADGNPLLLDTVKVPISGGHRRGTYNNTDGYSLSIVSRFLKNRLRTILGYRHSNVETNVYSGERANNAVVLDEEGLPTFDSAGNVILTDEAARDFIYWDPLTGELAPADQSFHYQPTIATQNRKGTTGNRSLGVVYQVTDWMSAIYNFSDNRRDQDIFRIILPGVIAPNSDGQGEDYGLRFNLLDRRLSINVNYFESQENNARTGASIREVLLEPHRTVWDAFADVTSDLGIAEGDPRYISSDERDERYGEGVNQTLFDKSSTGYDVRMIANLTSSWRLVFNFSDILEFTRRNLFAEDEIWRDGQAEDARSIYQAYVDADDGSAEAYRAHFLILEDDLNEFFISEDDRLTYEDLLEFDPDPEAANEFLDSLSPIDRAYGFAMQEMDLRKLLVELGSGVSPMKANMITAYSFREGKLKGFTFGGGFSWRDGRILNRVFNYYRDPDDPSQGTIGRLTPRSDWAPRLESTTDYVSDDDFRLNLMAQYRTKLKIGRQNYSVRFQVNVNNALEGDYRLEPLRYTETGAIRRYQIFGPRTWRFSTTIDW